MGSYFDALGPWIYELGVVVNGHLDYMIPGGVPCEAKVLHEQMPPGLLLVFGVSFK